jgi:hypothetical protein
VRCKLGPASFAAGMPEPSLPPMAPAGYGVSQRPLGEVEIKKVYRYHLSRSENPFARACRREQRSPRVGSHLELACIDAQDTRTQVTSENG